MNILSTKIENGNVVVGIVGLGYVGLPLAIEFSKKFKVVGYDVNKNTVKNLLGGKSHIQDISDAEISSKIITSFYPTSNPEELSKCDFIIICVPTPLSAENEPDLKYITSACTSIEKILKKGQFVILESTTYPGTTEETVLPILESSGLKVIEDFGLAYSPERIDPGNIQYTVSNTPKVVGGINKECTEIASKLYGSIIEKIVTVTDPKTAEAVKIVENIFRNVNIALANELALIFEKMNIDTWEVMDAASTKPYGFMPFYPGPGIGGHCIPLDPFYMSYKAKKYGFIPRFIETSGEINNFMRVHAVNLVEKGLKKANKKVYGSNVSVMGLSYKKDIDDTRESPSKKIIEELVSLGVNIKVYDPYAESIRTNVGVFNSEKSLENAFYNADGVIFVTDHSMFKEVNIRESAKLMESPVIIDCKNLFSDTDGIIYLGIGKNNNYNHVVK
ncbi:nucleotide sugar dehydrogenase [Methanococcus maripaludis]|uniref:UDP-N-acetyl-D-mannosamine dehydrogenase n=1 Tax=Methanococcus maripaludis TaxID=39152 RepID=A0A7J9PB75_METMI|nr:nucleotide sugar dehydrogenase [Methanococcus maripaludis]MBA2860465.1 UDP-N-acetyl-D-glucosamine dehydrogenase [Methanococcus maripaludis]